MRTLEPRVQVIDESEPRPREPRRWPWLVPVVAALAIGGAIVVVESFGSSETSDLVLVTTDAGAVSLIDPFAEDPTLFTIDDAYAAPDSETIYRIKAEGTVTQLDELDAANGSIISTQEVPGRLELASVSPDGDAVALMPDYGGAPGLYLPAPRESTSITVAHNDGSAPRVYELAGTFEPETFSLDLDTLFLIEFWPPLEPDRYFVRQLDLETGLIRESYTPEVEIEPAMRGRARAQVMDPAGRFLYTLYNVASDAPPLHDPLAEAPDDGGYWSFVHVLDLREEHSICIFLPEMFGRWSQENMGLGISPDGEKLYVVDSVLGTIAAIDTRDHLVEEIVAVDKLAMDAEYAAPPSIAVGRNGHVFVTKFRSVVIELDVRNGFEPVGAIGLTRETRDGIRGISLSPRGDQLRMAVDGEIAVYDLKLDREVATVTGLGSGGEGIDFVGAPPNTVGRYPLECAC